ncbi:hypothetical protein CcI156_07975 [Frankia sp. CcI156]|uniref:hypothetical protein n=1 Tax=Frankia TaxID=1854 RepID=UPI00041A06AF|nr:MULTISPECIES: hypothetical protein [Frankia]OFB43642.1 hypothetical protein Manayef4_11420 [Frankia sp. CgIM4]OHV57025.1 hypothetical protein CgIS1_08290 [Frankia sp. CgIS1]ONH27394.1 hypothetical protein CcI156_07975 [Frankia sp. CcI156]TFE31186.1 hypothetical protein E0F15_10520 [Frankia sp. B2]
MPPPEEMSREELVALVVARAGLIEQLRAGIAEREERLAGQERRVEELAAEVDRLRRAGSRNSGNPSLPPSSDGVLPGRVGPNRAERRAAGGGKKKRGKQPGRTGGRWLGGRTRTPGRGAFSGRGV